MHSSHWQQQQKLNRDLDKSHTTNGEDFKGNIKDEEANTDYRDYNSNPNFEAKDKQSNGEDFEGNFEDEEANADYEDYGSKPDFKDEQSNNEDLEDVEDENTDNELEDKQSFSNEYNPEPEYEYILK